MAKNLTELKTELKDRERLEQCARQFGVVGDLTRLKICYTLCHYPELSVNEISKAVGVSPSAVSHALAKLFDIQLVKKRKEAQTVYYSLKSNKFTNNLKDLIV
ncbi:MAG: metalloregulator ArsR/SmtB family transcription factor [Candidatus Woykebacteria bacterium]